MRLKIISNLVVYIGIALFASFYALQILFIFHIINFMVIFSPLPIISFFLICLGCGITDDKKNEKNEKEKIENVIP
jgi:hypothetical protein